VANFLLAYPHGLEEEGAASQHDISELWKIRVTALNALSGQNLAEVRVSPADSVRGLRHSIRKTAGIPSNQSLRLIFEGCVLPGMKLIGHCGIRDQAQVFIVLERYRPVVTCSSDYTARVWDWHSGCCRSVLEGHRGEVNSAAFNADSERVVTASSDCTAIVWNAADGSSCASLVGHRLSVASAAFAPSGLAVLTCSWDCTARIWDPATGSCLVEMAGHIGPVLHASFSPDGETVLTASTDCTARLWNSNTGEAMLVLDGHKDWVKSAVFSNSAEQVMPSSTMAFSAGKLRKIDSNP